MINSIVRSGDSAQNYLKVNNDGFLFAIPAADEEEELLLQLFSNDTGSNMAVNASTGTITNIWDGTGVGDTGTNDFTVTTDGTATETAAAMKEGTNGLDVALVDRNKLFFGGTTNMSSSSLVQFWIQPITGWQAGKELRIELRDTNGRIGNRLNVINYMAGELIGTWKLVQIPLVDFGAGTIGTVTTVRLEARNANKNFYLDSLVHGSPAGTGVDPIYLLKPSSDQTFRVTELNITLTSASASTTVRQSWDPTNFANIGALASGILFFIERHKGEEVITRSITRLLDLISLASSVDEVIGINQTTINIRVDIRSILLNGRSNDQLRIIVRDDLSSLSALTVNTRGIIRKSAKH